MPAPVGGWNARDGLAEMDKRDAVKLDNYFPGTGSVKLRRGSSRHAVNVGRVTAFTRASTATYIDGDNVLQTAAIDVMRFNISQTGDLLYTTPLIESAATNRVLWNRDLTNAAWTKTNMTTAFTATGRDGAANSATQITATASNASVTQAITSSSRARVFSLWVKKVSGASTFQLTLDGSSWSTVVNSATTTTWARLSITTTNTNPTVGIRLLSSGHSIIVDFLQEEDGSTATSAIPTTTVTVTRAADTPTYSSGSSASAITADVESLMSWSSGASSKLFAATNGCIYDVGSGGSVSTPDVTGLTSDRWHHENFKGYLFMLNGADTPRTYNGSHATQSITGSGLTSSNLLFPWAFKERLFMVEKNTLNAWYLGTGAISGAASKLDFSGYCRLGGVLVAGATWTRDGGSGSDDYCVFLTSKGEVLVYQGTDPSSSTTWALVGVFRIGAPVGDKPFRKVGADLVVICEDGYVSLSMVLPVDRAGAARGAISDKIRDAVADATRDYRNNYGWQAILYPQSNWLLFNVPTAELSSSEQHVMNTITGAWCRFTGWDAYCWELHNDELYFGTSEGQVALADTGWFDIPSAYSSSGATAVAITGTSKPAFSYFGSRTQQKHFKMVRPVISSEAQVDVALALNTDFEDRNPQAVSTPAVTGSVWDEAVWDEAEWGSAAVIRRNWLSVSGIGYCGALAMRTSTKGVSVALNSIDYLFESGGVV